MNGETCETKNTPSDQMASNNAIPSSVAANKHPDVKPVAGHCYGQGGNVK